MKTALKALLFPAQALALLAPGAWGADWGLNDVSILLPLPDRAAIAKDAPLAPASEGPRGPLLPAGVLKAVSPLTQGFGPADLARKLKAVGVRIDPCFEMSAGTPCQPQLRIVWQVLMTSPFSGRTDTADAAVHSFYNLSGAELEALKDGLTALREANPSPSGNLPLGVHPVLKAQGYDGAYWRGLRETVLATAGEANLARVTFMRAISDSIQWEFGGFDWVAGSPSPLSIPLLPPGTAAQRFIQNTFGNAMDFRDGSFLPAPANDFAEFMRDASLSAGWSAARKTAFLETLDRLENPAYATPARADCASCHLAQQARLSLQRHAAEAFLSPRPALFAPGGAFDFDLANPSTVPAAVNRIRAFGYYRSEPAVSQRTVNESAAVAAELSRRTP